MCGCLAASLSLSERRACHRSLVFDAMMKAAFLLPSLPRSLSFLSSSSFGAWASLQECLVSHGATSPHSSLVCSPNLMHDTYWGLCRIERRGKEHLRFSVGGKYAHSDCPPSASHREDSSQSECALFAVILIMVALPVRTCRAKVQIS